MNFKIQDTIECDVLIIGAGLAGIRSAYDLLKTNKKIILVASGGLCSGSSFSPFNSSLRAQLPLCEEDKEDYVESLVSSGKGIANEQMYKIIVNEITGEIKRLEELMIPVTYHNGRAACFAEKERILAQIRDWGQIRKDVNKLFHSFGSLFQIINADLEKLIKVDNQICGALVLDDNDNFIRVNSKFVILATGGYCGLYEYSLNTKDICGIGHSLAMDVGCELINMEFQQFIPALITPKKNLLFGEILLNYCDKVEDEFGKDILQQYLPKRISEKDCLEKRASHGPFSSESDSKYFDLCMMEQSLKKNKLSELYLKFNPLVMQSDNFMIKDITDFYLEKGIDLSKQKISIAPFAHCSNGGILIDKYSQTKVSCLFAAGECTGNIHGADRQGGIATATSIVFGSRAAKRINQIFDSVNSVSGDTISNKFLIEELINWSSKGDGLCPLAIDIQKDLSKKLWMSASVLRSEAITKPVYEWVSKMLKHFNANDQIKRGQNIRTILKAYNSLRVSKVILYSILERKESRGGHYRVDFPNKNDSNSVFKMVVNDNLMNLN